MAAFFDSTWFQLSALNLQPKAYGLQPTPSTNSELLAAI